MTRFLSFIILSVGVISAAWAWDIKVSVDAMTDETSRIAFVKSNDGSQFSLLRRGDNSVWGYLQLSGMNQFMVNERLMVRVDINKPAEYNEDLEKLSIQFGPRVHSWEWNPNLIGFRVWHGQGVGRCGIVKQLFDGNRLIVRYHPNQSTTKDIEFDISANHESISTALGFDVGQCLK